MKHALLLLLLVVPVFVAAEQKQIKDLTPLEIKAMIFDRQREVQFLAQRLQELEAQQSAPAPEAAAEQKPKAEAKK